jgi:hypothetical protein
MTKWSKVKVALIAAATVAAFQFGGCLNLGGVLKWDTIIRLATIGNIFD